MVTPELAFGVTRMPAASISLVPLNVKVTPPVLNRKSATLKLATGDWLVVMSIWVAVLVPKVPELAV